MAIARSLREIAREEIEYMGRDAKQPIHYFRIGAMKISIYDDIDDGNRIRSNLRYQIERMLEEVAAK